MKKILLALMLLIVLIVGCTEAPQDYLYEFKVYSGGVLIYHNAVPMYTLLNNNKYQLHKNKDDFFASRGPIVIGDMVIKQIRIDEWKTVNNTYNLYESLSTPENGNSVPNKNNVDTLGRTY